MGYVTIAAQLKSLLEGVSGLNAVYDYDAKELKKYPAATITAQGHQGAFSDLQANRHEYAFVIRIYYQTEDAASAESVMRTVVDAVMNEIETHTTLNDTCSWARPSEASWGFLEREVPLRYAQITVRTVARTVVR